MIPAKKEALQGPAPIPGNIMAAITAAAKDYLTSKGFVVRVTEVIGVELEDKKGNLNHMLTILAEGEISINYIYSFVIRDGKAPVMVFHTNDVEKAIEILKSEGVKVVAEADL